MRVEIRFVGLGGQGIVKAGLITAIAACIYCNKKVVLTQSYGPESRGRISRSEVIISDDEIDFPMVTEPDILVLMAQNAYDRYVENIKKNGIMILDPDMIPHEKKIENVRIFRVPAMRIAENLGERITANIVMLGSLTAITGVIDREAMIKAIRKNVPRGLEEVNLEAFKRGYEYGENLLRASLPP